MDRQDERERIWKRNQDEVRLELERQQQRNEEKFKEFSITSDKARVKIEELKALTALAPILTSENPSVSAFGKQLLTAIKLVRPKAEIALNYSGGAAYLIDAFETVYMSGSPPDKVIAATSEIGRVYADSDTSPQARSAAKAALTHIAKTQTLPMEARRIAELALTVAQLTPERTGCIVGDKVLGLDRQVLFILQREHPSYLVSARDKDIEWNSTTLPILQPPAKKSSNPGGEKTRYQAQSQCWLQISYNAVSSVQIL